MLVAEDPHFYYHDGIDGDAIQRAMALNLKEKRIVRGASTLPQQLAKNLYLSSSKSILRKSKEMVIALFMDRVLSKQRILEIYLNVAEWGRGLYGAEAASRFYFQKPASMLSMQEAAYLASLLPNPVFYADPSHSAQTLEREGHILDALNDPRYQKQLEVP